MGQTSVEILGTLQPDGTLVLDEKPNLPPGRVAVVLRPEPAPAVAGEGWWQYMQGERARREAAGHRFLNEQEMTAWIDELRSDDDRIERAYGPGEDTGAER